MTREALKIHLAANYADTMPDYVDGNYVRGLEEGYKKGWDDADKHPKNPWISVEERLPKKTRELELLEDEHDKVVIVCRRFGEAVTAYLDAEEIWRLYPTGRPFYGAITHWMPIPSVND